MAVEQSAVNERFKAKFGTIGLPKARLDVITAKLANKMNDDATDEDIDNELDALNEMYPFSEIKKNEDRAVSERKKTEQATTKKEENQDSPDEPAWFKQYRENQDKKFAELEASQTINTRKESLIKSLKGVDKDKIEKVVKNFGRMTFENDEEFEDYLSETKEDFKADIDKAKLDGFDGKDNPGGGNGKQPNYSKVKKLSADDAKAIVDNMG